MIQGFSEQTKPLTDYEDKVILPLIVQGLHGKVGKHNTTTIRVLNEIANTRYIMESREGDHPKTTKQIARSYFNGFYSGTFQFLAFYHFWKSQYMKATIYHCLSIFSMIVMLMSY